MHYKSHHDLASDTQKYFHQRYDIFSKYDEGQGVFMTRDSWFGVTPEAVANQIASHVEQIAPADKSVLIDAFAGVGGNAIAFARSGRWDRIFAIEKDPITMECAKHNARIYGVENKIWWILGDCFEVLETRLSETRADAVIFGSPPWGGPTYGQNEVFDLESMQPYNLQKICDFFLQASALVVLYLPRNSDLRQLAKYRSSDKPMPVIHYCLKGASRAICAYIGPIAATGTHFKSSRG